MPRSYSVYEAKSKLSELLRIVKNGNEVVILERGKPIAKVQPLRDQDQLFDRLTSLKEQGLIIAKEPSKKGSPRFPKADRKIEGGLDRFLEDR